MKNIRVWASALLLAGVHFASAQSPLVNGNFENSLTGWQYSGVSRKSPAIESNYSACFNTAATLSQTLSVCPGGSYTMGFTYAPGSNTNQTHIGFKVTANGTVVNGIAYEYSITYPSSPITNRYRVSSSFVVPSGVTNVTLTFTNESSSNIKPLLDQVWLRLNSAITILTHPQSQTVNVGDSATFSVEAIGTPVLNYQWYFEGTMLAGATASSLTLSNLQQTNTGLYMVMISDPYGTNWTSAQLAVAGPLMNGSFEDGFVGWNAGGVWVQQPGLDGTNCVGFGIAEELAQTFTVQPGSTYQLSFDSGYCGRWGCSAVSVSINQAGTELNWTGDAVLLEAPEGYVDCYRSFCTFTAPAGCSNVTVKFKDGSPDDGCDGYPIVDNVAVHTIVITAHPQSEVIAEGQDLTFSVAAQGTSTLSYQWKYNGTPITGATQSSLPMTNLQVTDSGTYTVLISDSSDIVETAPAILTVAGAFTNGSFEIGFTGWKANSYMVWFDPGLEGDLCAAFDAEGQISQSFSVTPGNTYTLQYDFAEYGSEPGNEIWAGVQAGSGNYLDLVNTTSTPVTGPDGFSGHYRVTAQFTVPQGVTAVTLYFYDCCWALPDCWTVIDAVSVQ